jgi:uncharacterized protein YdeI (YjbR/CyaY-like superfamily)
MAPPKTRSELPVRSFASSADWEAWLAAQPLTSKGVWLKLAKSASGIASVSKQEAIDGALCHGWIDGLVHKFDADYWLVRLTPRRPKGKWSQINRARALVLIKLGRMQQAGMKEIERAKLDGRWKAAYAPQSKATVPEDLLRALDRNSSARRNFDRLDRINRYAILYRVHDAKRPETRAQRIKQYVTMLSRGETIHPTSRNRNSQRLVK